MGDIFAGTEPTRGAAPEDVPDADGFAVAFWEGVEAWSRRYTSLPKIVPGVPAPPEVDVIRARAEADDDFGRALASLEEIRSRRDPAPARRPTAFSLGLTAAANEMVNRT